MLDIKPIATTEQLEAVRKAAHADGHRMVLPTHLFEKKGKIVGYSSQDFSLVNVWMDSTTTNARDSLEGVHLINHMLRAQGKGGYAMPCVPSSPYWAHMEKLGMTRLKECTLFYKDLR